jgi:hypothetical protein
MFFSCRIFEKKKDMKIEGRLLRKKGTSERGKEDKCGP